jgi:hypothetical protein
MLTQMLLSVQQQLPEPFLTLDYEDPELQYYPYTGPVCWMEDDRVEHQIQQMFAACPPTPVTAVMTPATPSPEPPQHHHKQVEVQSESKWIWHINGKVQNTTREKELVQVNNIYKKKSRPVSNLIF